jgi:ubiquinone/menaquinone biosynthesis C-methylase UbiE
MKTLDVGCGDRGQGDVNLDVVRTKDCNIIGDTSFLPFRDNCFNNLVAQALLEHLENPTQGLREFMRVLKPNGTVMMIVPKPWLTNNSRFLLIRFILNLPITLFPQFLKNNFKSLRRLKKEPRMRHKSIITKTYMEQQAQKIGFQIIEFTEMEDLFYYYFPRRKRQKLRKLFQFKPKLYHCHKIVCQKHIGKTK